MKEYEILAFKTTNSGEIWNRISNDLYSIKSVSFTLKECLKGTYSLEDKCLEIYKIKRLSDNQIFTIGDKIKSSKWYISEFSQLNSNFTLIIKSINIVDNTIQFKLSDSSSILLKNIDRIFTFIKKDQERLLNEIINKDLNNPKLSINDILEVIDLSQLDINKLIDIINSKK